ncbi:hypothetical protein ACSTIN_23145, partial [Vibrio parahaemolyticus]
LTITDTGGAISLPNAVTLGGTTNLTATTVTFDGTVDGAQSLSITGNAVFASAVGNEIALAALSVTGAVDLTGADAGA